MSRRIRLVLGALLLSSQVGCLIWPFPTGQLLSGRGRITPQYAGPLKVGQSTREEVLLHLGEPDEVLEGGSVFIYRWTEAQGFLAVGGYGSGVLIPFPGHRAVRLEFDADARLLRLSFERGGPAPTPEPASTRSGSTSVPSRAMPALPGLSYQFAFDRQGSTTETRSLPWLPGWPEAAFGLPMAEEHGGLRASVVHLYY